METKPIRQVQRAARWSDFETGITNLEKTLLENDAQDLVAQEFRCTLLGQRGLQSVAAIQCQQLAFCRDSRKLEQVERSIHGIDGKKPRRRARVFHAVQIIRNVGVRDSPQR